MSLILRTTIIKHLIVCSLIKDSISSLILWTSAELFPEKVKNDTCGKEHSAFPTRKSVFKTNRAIRFSQSMKFYNVTEL